MIKRYFSLFDIKMLISVLAVFYILIITANNINGWFEIIGSFIFITAAVLLWNTDATENWKWVFTGDDRTLTNSVLTPEGIKLREARKGNERPLFVWAYDEYYYYDDNFTKAHKDTILDMTDSIDLLTKIKQSIRKV